MAVGLNLNSVPEDEPAEPAADDLERPTRVSMSFERYTGLLAELSAEKDRTAELLSLVQNLRKEIQDQCRNRGIIWFTNWACSECVDPKMHPDLIVDGYRCPLHRAAELLERK